MLDADEKLALSNLTKDVREMLKWIRFEKRLKLKEFLEKVLPSEKEKKIYELTDGKTTAREISANCDIALGTVANYWKKWKIMGIIESVETGKKYQKICSLIELGIDVQLEKTTEDQKPNIIEPMENSEGQDQKNLNEFNSL